LIGATTAIKTEHLWRHGPVAPDNEPDSAPGAFKVHIRNPLCLLLLGGGARGEEAQGEKQDKQDFHLQHRFLRGNANSSV
jgi:hypothetical protein